jgi:hypothetical protein
LDQDIVFSQRDVLTFDEVRAQTPHQGRLRIKEGAPGPHFGRFEPLSHVE